MTIEAIRNGSPLSLGQRLKLTAGLAWPAMVAQLSSMMMQYIDAAMVGHLGADDSASVGLVATSLWLFWGICSAATMGFSVQVAHSIGASDFVRARKILRQGITTCLCFALIVAAVGAAIAFPLPHWLGGEPEICHGASIYFLVFVLALPLFTMNYLAGGMLRCSGNMKVAGGLNVMMCVLDVIFNYFLIFPTREVAFAGTSFVIPGCGLGVLGAALGTAAAEIVTAAIMMWFLCFRQKELRISSEKGSFRPTREILRNAFKVSAPMTLEHAVICGAQIAVTIIVAPLGVMAIAANAFAVTAESLCYMPGYGLADAATTLVGQSYGAKRKHLARSFGYITVVLGMLTMGVMGVVLYLFAPDVMSLMSPVPDIISLGAGALRIEAFAEPMFAASIVAYGVMIGVGDTVVPAAMNFGSIWLVRVPLAAMLAPSMGLNGVWIAMCIELCFRGAIFLWRLISGAWLKKGLSVAALICLLFAPSVFGQSNSSTHICNPLSLDMIRVSYPHPSIISSDSNRFLVSVPDDFAGRLQRNVVEIEAENLVPTLTDADGRVICLSPLRSKDSRQWILYPDSPVGAGVWTLHIPPRYFMIVPETEEVADIDVPIDSLRSLAVGGAWHVAPSQRRRKPIFTIQDDDGVTGSCLLTDPREYSSWGYFTILFPVLESLGLKGTVSLEGRRAGFTDSVPTLNDTGLIARRMQDEYAWEIQSHSMQCAGEYLNCWYVDNLRSPLACSLLREGEYHGSDSYSTVSVFDAVSRRQFMPDSLRSGWVEVSSRMVKPYVGDFNSRKALFYDSNFDVDYHWGEWFRIADSLGIHGRSWVSHNIIASHALTPKINAICPNGFADNALVTYNLPPFMSTVSRLNLEGQQLPDYKGEANPDNSYPVSEMRFYRDRIIEASQKGAWIVFALHAYRKCWKNYLPGALVSEGGSYPDAWVAPMASVDPIAGSLAPPDALGISSWSEWHPCPGTRLYMLWELLRLARDLGMTCVSSAEGFEIMGNKEAAGYFSNGINIGYNQHFIRGTSERYPHFLVSADGEMSYFNPLYSREIIVADIVSDGVSFPSPPKIYSIDGRLMKNLDASSLPKGVWIVDGKKYLITH